MNTLSQSFRTVQAVALSALLAVTLFAQEPKAPAAPVDTPPPAAPDTPVAPAGNADASAAPTTAPAPAAQTPVEAATPSSTAAPGTPAPAAEPPLRSLDGSATPTAEPAQSRSRSSRSRVHISDSNERVAIGHDVELRKNEKANDVVAVFGSATVEGEVSDEVSAVFGDVRVTGPVRNQVVAVMGDAYVNSKVGSVTAVLGDIELGPDAEVSNDVVSVGGEVRRDPKAIVHGNVQHVGVTTNWGRAEGLRTWFTKCLMLGRPLAFDDRLGWAWGIAGICLAFYILLALLFRRGIESCAETLETRPGSTLLASILTILLSPIAIALLAVTIVGAVVVPFVTFGLFVASLFGKAVMLAWIGRRFTKFFGNGPLAHAAVAVLIGGLIVLLLYTVPVLGFLTHTLLGFLGLGAVIYTLILRSKRDKAEPVPQAPAPAPFVGEPAGVGASAAPTAFGGSGPAVSAGFGAAAAPVARAPIDPGMLIGAIPSATPPPPAPLFSPVAPASTAFVPPPVVASTLPRASLWIRVGALLIDVVLLLLVLFMIRLMLPDRVRFEPLPGAFFFLTIYGAILWKLKGSTIGGIICGLKVVRTDNRELDWATAIVRGLSCLLSFFPAALGFIWVAIDNDRQSWHDKIAGTVVVRLPKGMPLV